MGISEVNLNELRIKRNHDWKNDRFYYTGTLEIAGETSVIQLRVSEDFCNKVIELSADSILEAAKETSNALKSELLQHTKTTALIDEPTRYPTT